MPTSCRVVVPRFTEPRWQHPRGRGPRAAIYCLLTAAALTPSLGWCVDPVIPPINAGDMMRNTRTLEQSQRANALMAQKDIYPPEWSIAADDRSEIQVSSLQIRGNHQLSTDELMAVLQPYVGQTMPLSTLKTLTDAVAQRYGQADIPVRVYFPVQKFPSPTLVIQVIELKPLKR